MQKPLLLILTALLLSFSSHAQEDFIALKKRHKTLKTFRTGAYIECQLDNHQWINGYIKNIRNDSLFIRIVKLTKSPTAWGTIWVDSSLLDVVGLHLRDVYALPREAGSAEIFTNGTLLQIGSAGYMMLNIINGLARKEEVFTGSNLTNLGIAAGIFGIGTLLHLAHPPVWKMGKKYRLEYIRLK